jgi:hypothetical protein
MDRARAQDGSKLSNLAIIFRDGCAPTARRTTSDCATFEPNDYRSYQGPSEMARNWVR